MKVISPDPYRQGGTIISPKYRIDKFIATGGMGAVYSGVQVRPGCKVAIKLLKPDLLLKYPHYKELFVREVTAVQKFDHPNIVEILDHGETKDGVPFMVMEWLEGETLEDILNREKLGIERVSHLFEQICRGLAYAHEQRVLHLDIKPANIFVIQTPEDSEGIVKIIDFGLSKILSSDTGTTVTRFFGTLQYCSPEHFGGKFTFQSDIYSLGVTLYHMICGVLPIGGSFIAAKQYPAYTPPELPSIRTRIPGLPDALDALVKDATDSDPVKRPKSVTRLWEDFFQILHSDVSTNADFAEIMAFVRSEQSRQRQNKYRFPRIEYRVFTHGSRIYSYDFLQRAVDGNFNDGEILFVDFYIEDRTRREAALKYLKDRFRGKAFFAQNSNMVSVKLNDPISGDEFKSTIRLLVHVGFKFDYLIVR